MKTSSYKKAQLIAMLETERTIATEFHRREMERVTIELHDARRRLAQLETDDYSTLETERDDLRSALCDVRAYMENGPHTRIYDMPITAPARVQYEHTLATIDDALQTKGI